jgi:nitrite reductase/ring-hydroxylating ferredoxin subunit
LFRVEDGYCIDGPCTGDSLTPLALEIDAGGQVVLVGTAP